MRPTCFSVLGYYSLVFLFFLSMLEALADTHDTAGRDSVRARSEENRPTDLASSNKVIRKYIESQKNCAADKGSVLFGDFLEQFHQLSLSYLAERKSNSQHDLSEGFLSFLKSFKTNSSSTDTNDQEEVLKAYLVQIRKILKEKTDKFEEDAKIFTKKDAELLAAVANIEKEFALPNAGNEKEPNSKSTHSLEESAANIVAEMKNVECKTTTNTNTEVSGNPSNKSGTGSTTNANESKNASTEKAKDDVTAKSKEGPERNVGNSPATAETPKVKASVLPSPRPHEDALTQQLDDLRNKLSETVGAIGKSLQASPSPSPDKTNAIPDLSKLFPQDDEKGKNGPEKGETPSGGGSPSGGGGSPSGGSDKGQPPQGDPSKGLPNFSPSPMISPSPNPNAKNEEDKQEKENALKPSPSPSPSATLDKDIQNVIDLNNQILQQRMGVPPSGAFPPYTGQPMNNLAPLRNFPSRASVRTEVPKRETTAVEIRKNLN